MLAFEPPPNWNTVAGDFLAGLQAGFDDADAEIELSVYEALTSESLSRETFELGMALALKPDYVVLSSSSAALCEPLKQADIPFILYDGDVPDSGRMAYVGTDNTQAGREAADAALTLLPEGDIYTLVLMPRDKDNFRQRQAGFEAVAAANKRLTVTDVYNAQWDLDACAAYVQAMLAENTGIRLIYCLDATVTYTVARVIRDSGMTDQVYIIGTDLNDSTRSFLLDGTVQALLVQNHHRMGMAAADLIVHPSAYVFPVTIYVDWQVLTREQLK